MTDQTIETDPPLMVAGEETVEQGEGSPIHSLTDDQETNVQQRRLENPNEDNNSDNLLESSLVDGEKTPTEKPSFQLRKVVREEDQYKWELNSELAEHFREYALIHYSDVDMKKTLKEFPTPSNLNCIPVMDNAFKSLLRKEKKGNHIDVDKDWETVQNKVQEVMEPLGEAWQRCKLYQRGDEKLIDVFQVGEILDVAVMALGHAVQNISWFRRVHSLSALGTLKNVKETLKEEKVKSIMEKDSTNNLFPKEFDDVLKADKGKRTNLLAHFKPDTKEKKKTTSSSTITKPGGDRNDRRFVQRPSYNQRSPFPANPSGSNRGGGSYYSQNQKNPSYHNKGRQGKHAGGKTQDQHAFVSRLVACSEACTSKPKTTIPCEGSSFTPSGKNSEIHKQLEKDHQRSVGLGDRQGLGDPSAGYSNPDKITPWHSNEQPGGAGNGQGDRKHAGQRGHSGGNPKGGSIPEQCLRHPERGGTVQTHHKPETIEPIRPIPSFQDGGSEGCKVPSPERGLDVQDRSKGRVLLSSPGYSIPKTGPIQVERDPVRVPVSSLRLRPSPKDFHKIDESPNSIAAETRHSACDIPGRLTDHGLHKRGGGQGQRHSDVPVLPPGPNHKHEEVSLVPFTGARVLGSHDQQPINDVLPIRGENPEIDFIVSRGMQVTHNDSKEPLFPNREAVVNRCSGDTSSTSIEVPTTVLHKSTGPKTALRDNDIAFRRRYFGTEVVGGKSESRTRQSDTSTPTRADNLLGCSKDRGLGSSMSPRLNRGTVVRERTPTPYQYPGAPSSRISHQNIHQESQTKVYSYEDRQYHSSFLPSKHGRDQEPDHDKDFQKNLGISSATWDHNYCRMDSITPKCDSRLGVKECKRFRGVETVSSSVPINLSNDGTTKNRPVCIQNISPARTILQLESGPKMPCSGCILPGLDTRLPVCLPSILPDHKSDKADDVPISGENDSHHTSVANPTMVPSSHGQIDRNTVTPATLPQITSESLRGESSVTSRLLAKAGGLAGVRDRLKSAGVSEGASNLIINSRRDGTSQSYESAWKRWSMWCSGRGVDPFTCPVNDILEYLTYLFDLGTPSRTIGTHRSAISAYHQPVVVNNTSVRTGRHPLVSALIAGINNKRPPQCRYSFTWDIETVLCLFRSWSEPLTPKQLTFKVTTLLALIGVPRGAELHQLDLNFMADYGDRYVFQLVGTVKNVKNGKKPAPLEFHVHQEDKKLCPISCIRRYIALTEPWRTQGVPSAFFLSFQKPHKPVCKATLARWIKEALNLADIDTNVFQAHSLRGASTSKALLKGLSVKDVIDHGKWSLESTWQKFYHKRVESSAKKFQDSILKL